MEYYLAIKRSDILSHATSHMDLDSIVLGGSNLTQKPTDMESYEMPRIDESRETKIRLVASSAKAEESEVPANANGFPLWALEMF